MPAEQYGDLLQQIDMTSLPAHIAVIMDGNGRWAAARGLPRSAGHKAGAEAMRAVTEICRELGIQTLTVYAFSTENWKRSADEVGFLMKLFVEYLSKEVDLMNEQDIRLGFLGKREGLPAHVLTAFDRALDSTANNKSMQLNLAINYGGRDELTRAVRSIAAQVQAGAIQTAQIDTNLLAANLDTAGQPDPDLLIRPSGELRISNFLLWQLAYSEFWYSDKLWPDFGKRDLLTAVIDFQHRSRRFGGA